jgi:hypothetical protein
MDISQLQLLDPSAMTKEQLIYEIVNGYCDNAPIEWPQHDLITKLSRLRSDFGLLEGGNHLNKQTNITPKNNITNALFYKKYLKYKKKYLDLKYTL